MRNKVYTLLSAGLLVAGFATPVSAAMISYMGLGWNNNLGHSYTTSADGVAVTVSAWSDNYYEDGNDSLGQADLWAWGGYGLGICNNAENTYGCNSPEHGADNYYETDFFLFEFSTAVDAESVWINQWGGDSDVSYWAGTGNIDLNGLSLATLGNPTTDFVNGSLFSNGQARGVYFNLASPVTWLLVGAEYDNPYYKDSFKLDGVTFNPSPVPLPGAVWLFGSALLGLFGVTRRKKALKVSAV